MPFPLPPRPLPPPVTAMCRQTFRRPCCAHRRRHHGRRCRRGRRPCRRPRPTEALTAIAFAIVAAPESPILLAPSLRTVTETLTWLQQFWLLVILRVQRHKRFSCEVLAISYFGYFLVSTVLTKT